MAAQEFTLDLLGPIILEMRDRLRRVEDRLTAIEEVRLPAIERKLDSHNDDITVLSAMVIRHSSEPIAWNVMQGEIRRLRERVEALETSDR